MSEPFDPTPVVDPAEILSGLAEQMPGVDIAGLLEDTPEGDEIRPGQIPEGDPRDEPIELEDEFLDSLALELVTKCGLYDNAMALRREREREILDNYDMVPATGSGGLSPESERMASEFTQEFVDQVTARLVGNTLGADPLITVEPILGEDEVVLEEADSTERALNNYAIHEMDLASELPVVILNATKVGTSVARLGWEIEERRMAHYDQNGTRKEEVFRQGRVDWREVPNHNVVIWPVNIVDWQGDYEMVGHRSYYTRLSFEAKLAELGLGEEEISEILAAGPETDEGERERARNEGVEGSQLEDEDEIFKLTELWLHRGLPTGDDGKMRKERFFLILHEASRRIVRGPWFNRRASGNHPYFPIRYKMAGRFAWGRGVGEEALFVHSTDAALRTLSLDNLFAGAYWVNLIKTGSMVDRLWDRLSPGQNIPVDDVEGDFKAVKLGGDAPEVGQAIQDNRLRGNNIVGQKSVLSGSGDPTMKSGAGTGSTLALIENAETKFYYVGQRLKLDLSAAYFEVLELLADNAPEGILVRYAADRDVGVLRSMRWKPPRQRLSDIFHVSVQAPSVSTSNEARKMSYLALYNFALQHASFWMQSVLPTIQAENPEAARRNFFEVAAWLSELSRRITQHYDVPGVEDLVPSVPEAMPGDEKVAQLTQQLQQAQQQVQQFMQQAEGQAGPPS